MVILSLVHNQFFGTVPRELGTLKELAMFLFVLGSEGEVFMIIRSMCFINQKWSCSSSNNVTNRKLGIGIVPYSPIGTRFRPVGPSLIEILIEGDFKKSAY